MRIATYNLESLFNRVKALDPKDWEAGRQALEDHARVNTVLGELQYSDAIKAEIVARLTSLGLAKSDKGPLARLRQNRGHLVKRTHGTLQIVASGRDAWLGWVEMLTEPLDDVATRNTAMVIRDVGATVQAVVEADDRIALRDFSSITLHSIDGTPFDHVMLIDGNDDRGIDVGLMAHDGYEIAGIRSHVDDGVPRHRVFSRDCPEYTIKTPSGETLALLVNHLKSQGYGSEASNDDRRKKQATAVAAIYSRLLSEGQPNVAVVGDFNDTPDSDALRPLLEETDLQDVSKHPAYESDYGDATYFGQGRKGQKLDYVLLSPSLFARVTAAALVLKGIWAGKDGTMFEHYATVTDARTAASDHAAIYADLEGI